MQFAHRCCRSWNQGGVHWLGTHKHILYLSVHLEVRADDGTTPRHLDMDTWTLLSCWKYGSGRQLSYLSEIVEKHFTQFSENNGCTVDLLLFFMAARDLAPC